MSFRGLVSADEITAVYNSETKYLTLTAKGKISQDISDIVFIRQEEWVGGLLYLLEGTYGPPIEHPETKPFEKIQHEFMPNLMFSAVLVKTASGLRRIDIQYIVFGEKTAPHHDGAPVDLSSLPTESSQQGKDIFVPLDKEVEIKQAIPQGTNPHLPGSVRLYHYDHVTLRLTSVSNEGNTMVFTFKGIKLGKAKVQFAVSAAPPRIGTYLVTHDVEVIAYH